MSNTSSRTGSAHNQTVRNDPDNQKRAAAVCETALHVFCFLKIVYGFVHSPSSLEIKVVGIGTDAAVLVQRIDALHILA